MAYSRWNTYTCLGPSGPDEIFLSGAALSRSDAAQSPGFPMSAATSSLPLLPCKNRESIRSEREIRVNVHERERTARTVGEEPEGEEEEGTGSPSTRSISPSELVWLGLGGNHKVNEGN